MRMNVWTRRLLLWALSIVSCVLLVVFSFRLMDALQRHRVILRQSSAVLPMERSIPSSTFSSSSQAHSLSVLATPSVNIRVPFVVQAPFGNWDAEHQEACEEASILMVLGAFGSRDIPPSPAMQDSLLQVLLRRAEELGFPVDLTAEQAALLLRDADPSLTVRLLLRPTADDLKQLLDAGSLIIVPAAGRLLHNPYFRRPGPQYHMLVLRGYTVDGMAITNDPGTKHGASFVYPWATLLHANHDWNGGNVEGGERVVLVVSR